MEREQYDLMYRQEERHWWYVGMRRISAALLDRYPPATGCRVSGVGGLRSRHPTRATQRASRPHPTPEILDAGCGSGGMARFLAGRGRVTGIDIAGEAVALARRRGLGRLVRGSIGALPLRSESFDLVTSFDVLYHLGVEDDLAALDELQRVLRPGGVLLIRVPAYDWIRGAHDQAVHTRHRYTRPELAGKLERVGFRVEHTSYANALLFPIAPAKRLLERHDGSGGVTDLWQPPRPLNRVLADLLTLESGWVSGPGLPWGLSVFAVGRRVR